MQEEVITKRFTLKKDTDIKAATAAVMSAVFPALKAEGKQDSDATFSGTGRMAANEQSGFPAFKVPVSGILKSHGDGDFSAQITLKKGDGLGLTKVMGIMHAINVFVLPVIIGGMSWAFLRGSLLALIVGGGVGFLLALLIATQFAKTPKKSMENARKAVENKLSSIEFSGTF